MFLQRSKKKAIKSGSLQTLSDRELVAEYKRTNQTRIIGELFERYTHLIYGVCIKYLKNPERSKDAVMQIFEKLLKELASQEITYFKSWLYSVAKNHCLMILRKNKSLKQREEKWKASQCENMEFLHEVHLNNKPDNNLLDDVLQNSIKQLKTEQEKCIRLFYFKNKSYNEIVQITGYTQKQVKSYLQNGKRNLKKQLLEQGIGAESIVLFLLLYHL